MAQAKLDKCKRKAIARLRKRARKFVRALLARTGRVLAHAAMGGMLLIAASVPAQETMADGVAEVKATLQQRATTNSAPIPDSKETGDFGAETPQEKLTADGMVSRTLTIRTDGATIQTKEEQENTRAGIHPSPEAKSESNWWWDTPFKITLALLLGLILFRKYPLVLLRLLFSFVYDGLLIILGRPDSRPSPPIRGGTEEIDAQRQQIDIQNYRQESLFGAISRNNASQVEVLVRQGADVNAWDERGFIPLGVAAQHNATAAIAKLVELGADVDMRNKHGFTPLESAAVADDSADAILKLVALGADVNGKNAQEKSPLHRAASGGNQNAASALLNCGADINARDEDGWTPMHWAALKNKDDNMLMVDYLCDHGADTNARNNSGYTPAHMAAIRNCPAIINVLWLHDADLNAQTNTECTPYDIAESQGNIRALFRIIRCGGKGKKDLKR